MNLDTTLKVLQIVLGEAMTTNDCDITASFADSQVNNFSLGNQNVKSNGTTPVTVVDAPLIDTQRQVKEIRLFNNDTVPHNVTLQLFDGTDTWIVGTTATADAVPVGGSFVYTPEAGVCCTGSGGGGSSLTIQDDTGDIITSTGTIQFNAVKVSGSTPSGTVNMATITGAAGVGTTAGGQLVFSGGAGNPGGTIGVGGGVNFAGGYGGTGTGSTYGGPFYGSAGDGGQGTTLAQGGNIQFAAGDGGTSAVSGPGGHVVFTGGYSYGAGNGGYSAILGGNAGGAGNGGEARLVAGSGFGGGAGGNVPLTTGTGSPPGQIEVNNDPSLMFATYSWVAGAQLNNQTIFTTTRAMVVTAVIGRPDAANGSAATLTIVKAPSGTPPAGGTALTSDSVDLDGTPDTNQTLTLSVTLADITLAPGDSLCMTTTGALTLSAGCITVWGTPQ